MSVDADIDAAEDILGKTVDELQDDIEIEDDAVSGTLLYIDDYTGFSEDTDLQVGNFLAIHAEVPYVDDVEITCEDGVVLDSGVIVIRVTDKSTQTVTVVASKEGCESVTRELTLDGLTCEEDDD